MRVIAQSLQPRKGSRTTIHRDLWNFTESLKNASEGGERCSTSWWRIPYRSGTKKEVSSTNSPETLSSNSLSTTRPATPFAVKPIGAFYVFLAANIIAALYAPIQDCDETFNYWEPTHYLSHHYGLETWEYSPQYAIRSWLYISLHALTGSFRRLLPFSTKVYSQF